MQKDFDTWNNLKKNIDQDTKNIFFHEREIWFSKLGLNVGYEQDGKGSSFMRPVLILKKFNKHIFLGLPLSTSRKENKYYYPLKNGTGSIILSQIRLIDAKRLSHRIEKLPVSEFSEIKKKLRKMIL